MDLMCRNDESIKIGISKLGKMFLKLHFLNIEHIEILSNSQDLNLFNEILSFIILEEFKPVLSSRISNRYEDDVSCAMKLSSIFAKEQKKLAGSLNESSFINLNRTIRKTRMADFFSLNSMLKKRDISRDRFINKEMLIKFIRMQSWVERMINRMDFSEIRKFMSTQNKQHRNRLIQLQELVTEILS